MQLELIETGWDRVLDDAVAADHSEIRIICPFIKRRAALRLLKAGDPHLLRVITRFNLRDFYESVSDIDALQSLMEKGAQVRGVQGLHSKLYLFGNSRAIVTSANITEAALQRNHEFGFVAGDGEIIARCRMYFDRLWERAGDDLTLERLDRWRELLDGKRISESRLSDLVTLPDEGVDAEMTTSETIAALPIMPKAPQALVKFFGTSNERKDRKSQIFEVVEDSGCHWSCAYPEKKAPLQVKNDAVMFMGGW